MGEEDWMGRLGHPSHGRPCYPTLEQLGWEQHLRSDGNKRWGCNDGQESREGTI